MLVQALAVGAPSVRRAAVHDSAGFLAEELRRREALGYPPFSHLIDVIVGGADEARVERAAASLADAISAALPAAAQLLGPAPLFRRRRRHRRRLLVKALDRRAAVAAVRGAVEAATRARALRELTIAVDVDPQ